MDGSFDDCHGCEGAAELVDPVYQRPVPAFYQER